MRFRVVEVGDGMTRYLCTVDAEVIAADSEDEARDRMREMMPTGAVVVSCTEIEGETE